MQIWARFGRLLAYPISKHRKTLPISKLMIVSKQLIIWFWGCLISLRCFIRCFLDGFMGYGPITTPASTTAMKPSMCWQGLMVITLVSLILPEAALVNTPMAFPRWWACVFPKYALLTMLLTWREVCFRARRKTWVGIMPPLAITRLQSQSSQFKSRRLNWS